VLDRVRGFLQARRAAQPGSFAPPSILDLIRMGKTVALPEGMEMRDGWAVPKGYEGPLPPAGFEVDQLPSQRHTELRDAQLYRIVLNAAKHSGVIYRWLNEQDANALGRGERAKLHHVQRLSVTMRDSLAQVAMLLEGQDLEEPLLEPDPEYDEIRLAEVYQRVKTMQRKWTKADEQIWRDFQEILNFIAQR
jgi:hypothetical protein